MARSRALELAGLAAEQVALLRAGCAAGCCGPAALVSPEPPGFGDGEPFL